VSCHIFHGFKFICQPNPAVGVLRGVNTFNLKWRQNMKKMITAIILGAFVLAPVAQAGNKSPGVNKREHHQVKRIKQGAKSGELTRRETHRLAHEQAHIRAKEARFKADGELTTRERVKLHRDLNRSSRHIYRQKHDGQSR